MKAHAYDYSKLDNPEILQYIFHPRKEAFSAPPRNAVDYVIPVGEGVRISCRFYLAGKEAPCILFFHGNGEVVGDYDDIGPRYNSYGISLLAVDYRGYGQSTGVPGVTSMLQDCHSIFNEIRRWLKVQGRIGPLFVMGRSLGSASALELASTYQAEIEGLIIESGFASTIPLLNFLGADTRAHGITEADALRHKEKIKRCAKPTLIVHAEFDQFIPLSDARALLELSPALKEQLRLIV
ncbi:MAG: alpha/beta fold hydrolase [Pseudomonadota bacterium]